MGISINAPGSVNSQASMTGTLSIRKSTNTFEQMAGVSSSGGTSKKQLNYNHRDISGQLLRAKKPQSASAALTRAKSKVSMLQRAAASGQYDSREVANALAHARRMVRCAQLKVRNLREEEREQQSAQKENSGKSQQKEHEVKRRVAQKERQLKQKVAIENTQEVLRQKKKKNEMAQKQQRHRSQERGKIAEADFKYIKSQLEDGKGFGGGSSYCEDSGFTLDISDAAMSMAELEMMAQNQIEAEAEAEAEVEAEMSLTDGGTLAVTTAGTVTAGSGAGTAPDAAPAAAGVSVDVSV